MRSVREIVKQARALGERQDRRRRSNQKDFATRVGLRPEKLSDILHGRRPPPLDAAELWCAQLALTRNECAELREAMILELALWALPDDGSRDALRGLVRRLEREAAEVLAARRKLQRARAIIDEMTGDA